MAASKRKKKVKPVKAKRKGVARVKAADGGKVAAIAARKAKELGLEFAEGRNPGSMFFKGAEGQKLALQNSDEFLDLISVGGGKTKQARSLFELLDEIATESGTQARRGTTNLSAAGQASLEKATAAGRLVRNPSGAGFLSTAQRAGRKALDLGKKAAKSTVGGVSALLDPLFGALQNQPEGAELLRGFGIGVPDTKTNRRIGKHGGRMTAEAAASGRGVARQHFAVGGSAGASTLGETESETEAETTSEESGTGFSRNIADTGSLDNIINQLRGVKGFSNLGRSTLDDVLRTGLPTDVSGITEAAKIRAGQEFDDATNVIGERLANLGLVSSSAQTTAVARERAKLGERVAAAGLEAKVAAAESATNRRFGATSVDTSGQGTRAGALGAAGSLAGTSASLNSRTNTGFSRSGSGSSSSSSSGTSSSNSDGLGGFSNRSSSGNSGGRRTVGAGRAGGLFGSSARNASNSGGGGGTDIRVSRNSRRRFDKGGRVPELDDVLSGVLEGTFNPTADTLTRADRLKAEQGRIARFEEDNIGLENSRNEISEFLSFNHPGILRMLLGGPGGAGALQAADPGTNVTPGMQSNIDRSAKRAHSGARTPVPRQNFALGGPVEGDPEPISAPNQGAVPQPELPQENGQMVPGLLDPRRQFFEDGGGVAPGVDSGEDKVPAMLRAEELVITPELTEELMNVDPGLPQPGLITALQQLAQQPLEFGEEEGELVAGHGGSVQPGTIPGQFGIPIPGAQGQTGITPEGLPPGLQQLLDFISRQGQAQVDPTTGGIVIEGAQSSTPFPAGPDPANFVPGQIGLPDELPSDTGFDLGSSSVPGPPLQLPSLTESVDAASERKFTLEGGSPGTGRVGAAGIRAGLDPSKSPVTGGSVAPGVERIGPSGRGRVEGSFAITDPETGLPMDFSGEQMSRLERAQRIADLTRAAISTDPIGGPEKQSRMLRALEIANREVDSSVNEIIQGQKLAIERQQVQNAGVVAQGQLNASIAQTLQAQAQKVTAEGTLAKQVAELAANNPVVTAAMNKLEILAKNPKMDPDDRDRILAILTRELQVAGIELTESGFFADLFGAPGFAISPVAQEQGVPDPAGANDGQQELQALMSRAKAGMSAEDFQHIMEIM